MTIRPVSPLTGTENTVLEQEIDTKSIITRYRRLFKIDVSRFFLGIDRIQLFRCIDSGYRFFHPLSISGDGLFYEELGRFPWYYMDWKWEHEEASRIIAPGQHVLEIGCGSGSFLKKMAESHQVECTGLELNVSAASNASAKGLKIYCETVESHSEKFPGCYDVVCAFQVLEHVVHIREFLDACVRLMKPNGVLAISVPNNDSFIKYAKWAMLNMPPHHMGLWDKSSLAQLQELIGLRMLNTFIEPLQNYHTGYYLTVQIGRVLPESKLLSLIGRLINPLASIFLGPFRAKITGHTILAIFKKK